MKTELRIIKRQDNYGEETLAAVYDEHNNFVRVLPEYIWQYMHDHTKTETDLRVGIELALESIPVPF